MIFQLADVHGRAYEQAINKPLAQHTLHVLTPSYTGLIFDVDCLTNMPSDTDIAIFALITQTGCKAFIARPTI